MRLLISCGLASFALFALMACHTGEWSDRVVSQSTPATPAKPGVTPPAAAHSDGARRITTAQLQDLISKGQAYVVDVRNQAAYDLGHIHGAKLIPNTEIGLRLKELPRDKTIVTYCS